MRILDTDHCVAILRGKLDIGKWVEPTEQLFVTSVTVGELFYGASKSQHRSRNLTRVDALLTSFDILAFSDIAARRFGQLKSELEASGEKLADLDLQIASIALEVRGVLVTHNQRHFQRIAALKLDDWLVDR